MRAVEKSAAGAVLYALVLLNVLPRCAAHASLCAGNYTREQCTARGGAANRCCFFYGDECQRDSRVSVGSSCHENADLASCDASDCCSWAEGSCASDRDKRGCKTGVEMCACHGHDQAACAAVGCCSFADGHCSSAVGKQKCHAREATPMAEPITQTLAAAGAPPSAGGSLAWLGRTVAVVVVVVAGAVLAKLVRRRRLGEKLRSRDGQKLATHDGGIAIAQAVDSD